MGDELEPVKNNEQVSEVEPQSDHQAELEPECDPEVYPEPEVKPVYPEVDHVREPEPEVKPVDSVPEPEPEVELVDPKVDPVPEPEPEPEPEPVSTDSCEDVDIEPLSGKPYFPIVMVKSHIGVAHKYQLILPAQFIRMLPNKTIPVILTRGGRSWETAYMGEAKPAYRRFDNRWRAFVEDNNLKVGDVCVFELIKKSDTLLEFKVQVLRGDFPSKLLHKEDGTIDNPIVVD